MTTEPAAEPEDPWTLRHATWRLPVDEVLSIVGRGLVGVGTMRGEGLGLRIGEKVQVTNPDGSWFEAKVTGVERIRPAQPVHVVDGEAVGVLLRPDVEGQELAVGQVICDLTPDAAAHSLIYDQDHPADGPHGWIQWKGTEVCMDVHCACGQLTHVDGDFVYSIQCGACGAKYAVGCNIKLIALDTPEKLAANERYHGDYKVTR